jgi:hypothetical protein
MAEQRCRPECGAIPDLRVQHPGRTWLLDSAGTFRCETQAANGDKRITEPSDSEKILDILRENALHAYLATCDGDQPTV